VRRRGHRRTLARFGVVAFGLLLLAAVAPAATVAAANDRLPDLRSAAIHDLRIERSGGRKLLRFTTEIRNYGAGPFEIRGNRPNTSAAFVIDQIIYRTDGRYRRLRTNATVRYAGDGHDHYHVRRMATYNLWSTHGTFRDSKIGFCFFDTNPRYLSLPGAPRTGRYRQTGCGARNATSTRSGISVGWADKYPWNFAYQWIDVTGLPNGTYTLRNVVDLYGSFLESNEKNNCSYVRISIGTSSVRVLNSGSACVNDYSTTPYAADAIWGLTKGLGAGCDPMLFCTYNRIQRDELAVFMSRLLALPAVTQDVFDDDDGSRFEAYQDRVGAAGIMSGCGVRRFCPTGKVSRALAAVTVYRALGLTPSTTDHFTDDDGTLSEPMIDAVVDAGIMSQCATGRFCPTALVTRGEMARILHRAFPG
jgi:Lysyl oxidase/S-layer homology domain